MTPRCTGTSDAALDMIGMALRGCRCGTGSSLSDIWCRQGLCVNGKADSGWGWRLPSMRETPCTCARRRALTCSSALNCFCRLQIKDVGMGENSGLEIGDWMPTASSAGSTLPCVKAPAARAARLPRDSSLRTLISRVLSFS